SKEFDALHAFIDHGGALLYLGTEGTEKSNFNYFLEEFGISVNSDSVTRTSYFKYFHPKENFISNGIINREINRIAGKQPKSMTENENVLDALPSANRIGRQSFSNHDLTMVYPFGSTINVDKPSVPIISTGSASYPTNRPIGAVYHQYGKGKIVVLGSCHIFSDQYLDKEENGKLFDAIIKFLFDGNIKFRIEVDHLCLDSIDADDPDVSDYHYVPDIFSHSEQIKCCIQESEEPPKDFRKMFDKSLFKFDMNLFPKVLKAHEVLKVKPVPLTLIEPQFELPLPEFEPAVFPPTFRSLPPPPLELFDLDEEFATNEEKLAKLANKCSSDDIDYFIKEAGKIFGFYNDDSFGILENVVRQIIDWKKVNI
ncbi:hypothetical protein ROZALSC1DRAFT_30374, partial [Rozella allomycis CSF55]